MPAKRGKRTIVRNTSSAASGWTAAQKRGYAAMNRSNSARIATNRARGYNPTSGRSRSGGGVGIPSWTPQWRLFDNIGKRIKGATKR